MDLQIESKLLSVSTCIVPVHGGRAKNQYPEPFKKKIGNSSRPCGSHLDLLCDAVMVTVTSLLLNEYLINTKQAEFADFFHPPTD